MKRSEINAAIRQSKEELERYSIALPPFGYWTPAQARDMGPDSARIKANGMGWDITDFGSGDFDNLGAVLFTLRNGNFASPEECTPYAEKLIILKPGQRLPIHFHWHKAEDIINRAGGLLCVQVFNATADDGVDRESPVTVYCDGRRRTFKAGETFELRPGESITLTQRVHHTFWADKDAGALICGEVSSVNDDNTDNCFAEPVSRFAEIEEDEKPIHLLCNEYP